MKLEITNPSKFPENAPQKVKDYYLGKDYWFEYVRINGYSFNPKEKELKVLSKMLDLKVSHVRHCINTYLES
jgi:hypothetical protein